MKRGSADNMTTMQQDALCVDLSQYVHNTAIVNGKVLWQFGVYDKDLSARDMAKKAPVISTLIASSDLWSVLLKYSPTARVRDVFFMRAIKHVVAEKQFANTKPYSNEVFCVWWVGCIHVQMSHLRELKQYPLRFQYRISLLSAEQLKLYGAVMNDICTSEFSKAPTPARLAATFVAPNKHTPTCDIPRMFMPDDNAAYPASCAIPDILVIDDDDDDGHNSIAATPRKRKHQSVHRSCSNLSTKPSVPTPEKTVASLFEDACKTPALPTHRGILSDLKKHRASAKSDSANGREGRMFLERSLKTNRRTTLRFCSQPGAARTLWVEVRESVHADHEQIAQEILKRFNEGRIASRCEANVLKTKLIECWPHVSRVP